MLSRCPKFTAANKTTTTTFPNRSFVKLRYIDTEGRGVVTVSAEITIVIEGIYAIGVNNNKGFQIKQVGTSIKSSPISSNNVLPIESKKRFKVLDNNGQIQDD